MVSDTVMFRSCFADKSTVTAPQTASVARQSAHKELEDKVSELPAAPSTPPAPRLRTGRRGSVSVWPEVHEYLGCMTSGTKRSWIDAQPAR